MEQYLWYTLLLISSSSACDGYTFLWKGYAANFLAVMNVVVFNTDDKEDIESILSGYLAEFSDKENETTEDKNTTEFVISTLRMLKAGSYERAATLSEIGIASHILGVDVQEDKVICLSWCGEALTN